MKATVHAVNVDPRGKTATVFFLLDGDASISVSHMPFDPPKGIAYDRVDDVAVKEALQMLRKLDAE